MYYSSQIIMVTLRTYTKESTRLASKQSESSQTYSKHTK